MIVHEFSANRQPRKAKINEVSTEIAIALSNFKRDKTYTQMLIFNLMSLIGVTITDEDEIKTNLNRCYSGGWLKSSSISNL